MAVVVAVTVTVAVAVAIGVADAIVVVAVMGLGVRSTALAGGSLWWRRRPLLWRGNSRRQRDRVPVCIDMKRTWRVVVGQWVRALCLSVISFLLCVHFLPKEAEGLGGGGAWRWGTRPSGAAAAAIIVRGSGRGGGRGKEQRQSRAKRKGREEKGRREGKRATKQNSK